MFLRKHYNIETKLEKQHRSDRSFTSFNAVQILGETGDLHFEAVVDFVVANWIVFRVSTL
ncbi:hypothetical protein H6G04_25360 [Calothrix membranacea FACHB-236]|nr:hypothetical protein [Calothrix membranacea FACHB-236]